MTFRLFFLFFLATVFLGGCATTTAVKSGGGGGDGTVETPDFVVSKNPKSGGASTADLASAYAQSCVRGGKVYKCGDKAVVAIAPDGNFVCRPPLDEVPFVKPGEKACKGVE